MEQPSKYTHVFFDLDHTIWDFESNSRLTLQQLYDDLNLRERGIDDFDRFHKCYLHHNDKLWDRYRKGFMKVDELRWKRFMLALLDFKIGDEPLAHQMGVAFLEHLPTRTILFADAKEVLEYLTNKGYELHLITNGFEKTQHSKLKHSGIDHFFKEVITSEGSNALKPHKEIFEYALQKTGASAGTSIMIGDDPEVDIKGAQNAGWDQIYVNHINKEIDFTPTYTVYELKELMAIL
ncbi:MAG: YjjG family noncanonical pyrimidine nucleotidase [Chitinophagaceae bacterium]|jgi:putative hydrolase of the HAD superfamily|uniref:YjjG family noncanonical pyrimidine nucleotidase n=1 Tax=unclassified Paraflavitalea TaxID=2798305 RepID=UPI003D355A6F|nr:YjjG family noncanonical pyrimidine nucleotidase [Chitinophagaceae bacterium]